MQFISSDSTCLFHMLFLSLVFCLLYVKALHTPFVLEAQSAVNTQQGNVLTRMLQMIRRAGAVFMSRKTPWYVKLLLGAGLVYVLSPYDLIPEWVPVFGILDDLALAALLIAWASGYRSD